MDHREADVSDTVKFTIEHEVDIGSEEAQKIYAAIISTMINDGFVGEINPIDFFVEGNTAYIRFKDADIEGATGYRKISDAVSGLYIFSAPESHPDDVVLTNHEAEVVAETLEREAKRIRERISEVSGD